MKGAQLLLGEQADVVALDCLPGWKKSLLICQALQHFTLSHIHTFKLSPYITIVNCSSTWLEGSLGWTKISPLLSITVQRFNFFHASSGLQIQLMLGYTYPCSPFWILNFRSFSERPLGGSAPTLTLLTTSTLLAIIANSVRIVTRHQIGKKSTTLNGTFESGQKGILANFDVPFPATNSSNK